MSRDEIDRIGCQLLVSAFAAELARADMELSGLPGWQLGWVERARQTLAQGIEWLTEHEPEDDEESETFVCGECGIVRSWDEGAADDQPDVCDHCYEPSE